MVTIKFAVEQPSSECNIHISEFTKLNFISLLTNIQHINSEQ